MSNEIIINNKTMLEHALSIAATGVKILPMHPEDKYPLTQQWRVPSIYNDLPDDDPKKIEEIKKREGKLATTDPETIKRWWTENPNAKIGYPTSREDNPFWVIDLDKDGDNPKYMAWFNQVVAEHGDEWFKSTKVERTPRGGYHIYFLHPDDPTVKIKSVSKVNKIPGVDCKGEGGCIVGAPSEGYVIKVDAEIQPPPDWLVEIFRDRRDEEVYDNIEDKNIRTKTKDISTISSTSTCGDDNIILMGNRDNEMFRRASYFVGLGLPYELIYQNLKYINETRCKPPLSDYELQNKIKSAMKYNPNPENTVSIEEEPWDNIIDYHNTMSHTIPFPDGCYGGIIEDYIDKLSQAVETSKSLPGAILISIISGLVHNKYTIRVDRLNTERLSLWTVLFAEPSERKSKIQSELTHPIDVWLSQKRRKLEEDINQKKQIKEIIERQIALKKNKIRENTTEQERKKINDEINELNKQIPTIEPKPRIIIDDITPEKVAKHLSVYKSALLISDEGDIFETICGRYNKGKTKAGVFNKAYTGTTIIVDRNYDEADEGIIIENPSLAMSIVTQPHILVDLINRKEDLRGNGFLSRILFAIPEPMCGHRLHRHIPMPDHLIDQYEDIITKILELETKTINGRDEILLSSDAYDVYKSFELENEKLMRDDNILINKKDIGGKLVGNILRIAGCLHIIDAVTMNETPSEITKDQMLRAIKLGNYFLENMTQAYDYGVIDTMKSSPEERVINHIRKKTIRKFKKSELTSALKHIFSRKSNLVDDVLRQLADNNYIRRLPTPPPSRKGGRPTEIYEVNPQVFETPTPSGEPTEENQMPQELDDQNDDFIQNNFTPPSEGVPNEHQPTSTPPRTAQVPPNASDHTPRLPVRDDRNNDNSVNNTKCVLTNNYTEDTPMQDDPTNPAMDEFFEDFSKIECPEEKETEDTTDTIDNIDALVDGINF